MGRRGTSCPSSGNGAVALSASIAGARDLRIIYGRVVGHVRGTVHNYSHHLVVRGGIADHRTTRAGYNSLALGVASGDVAGHNPSSANPDLAVVADVVAGHNPSSGNPGPEEGVEHGIALHDPAGEYPTDEAAAKSAVITRQSPLAVRLSASSYEPG